jgi:uncharacterized protein YggE
MKTFGRLIFVFIVLSLTSCAKTTIQKNNVLVVVGYGTAEFVADSVTLELAIVNFAHKAEEAMSKTKSTINALNNILLELKITEGNINRSNIGLTMERDTKKDFIEYSSKQCLSITFDDNNPLGIFLEKIISYEDIFIMDHIFSHTNINNYEIQARLDALQNAEEAAKEMARKMDVKLGKINSIEMHPFNNPSPGYKSYTHEYKWKQTIERIVTVEYNIK